MNWKYPYMIHTLTDETYAIDCAITAEAAKEDGEEERQNIMFSVAFLSRILWMIGTLIGGMAGELFHLNFEGLDFCMTALFVTILTERWEKTSFRYFDDFSYLLYEGFGKRFFA